MHGLAWKRENILFLVNSGTKLRCSKSLFSEVLNCDSGRVFRTIASIAKV